MNNKYFEYAIKPKNEKREKTIKNILFALKIAFIDFPFIILLIIATIVSTTGNAKTISGATITTKVYVLATPNIEMTAKQ